MKSVNVLGAWGLAFACVLAAGIAAPAAGFTILAGSDFFRVVDGTAWVDFSASPIPADFFGPGSDPFDGLIVLEGVSLGGSEACPDDMLGAVHAILSRDADCDLPALGTSCLIPARMIALKLKSGSPVPVSFGGAKSWLDFDVWIEVDPPLVSPVPPVPPGSLLEANATALEPGVVAEGLATGDLADFGELRLVAAETGTVGEPFQDYLGITGDMVLPDKDLDVWVWEEALPPTDPSCRSNICVDLDTTTELVYGVLHLGLEGVCPESAISTTDESWGGLKASYR